MTFSNKTTLLINGLLETIAGAVVIFSPNTLLWDVSMDAISMNIAKMYGILALAFGGFSLVLFLNKTSESLERKSALVCIGFHIFLSFHLWGLYQGSLLNHPGPLIVHVSVALLFLAIYLKTIRP